MNFGGIPPGTSGRAGSAPSAASLAPAGMLAPAGNAPCGTGQGRGGGSRRHDVELPQTDAGCKVCFQPSAVIYLTKGNL